jgi:integrase/recombinase XerC
LIKKGADLRSVQELLGHAHLSSTQMYTHIAKDDMIDKYQAAHPRGKKE